MAGDENVLGKSELAKIIGGERIDENGNTVYSGSDVYNSLMDDGIWEGGYVDGYGGALSASGFLSDESGVAPSHRFDELNDLVDVFSAFPLSSGSGAAVDFADVLALSALSEGYDSDNNYQIYYQDMGNGDTRMTVFALDIDGTGDVEGFAISGPMRFLIHFYRIQVLVKIQK